MSVLETSLRAQVEPGSIEAFFGARAADVDAGSATVRDGLAESCRHGLATADIGESVALVAEVARHDVSTAFSAWAHRMTIDYISQAPADSGTRAQLPALATAETLGATALAAGTANVLAGVPLPLTYVRDGDDLVLDGRIPWASNLIDPFVVVTAVASSDGSRPSIVVALDSGVDGLEPAPFPELLALNATGSTTVKLSGARIPSTAVVAEDLSTFVHSVLARFLLLQGAFCSGLANRALEEATANLGPMGEAIQPELDRVIAETAAADDRTSELVTASLDGRAIPTDDLLTLRLRWSELAASAVHLELAATGGGGYLASSATARRVREAAFLPIQAPTEVLLRWLLSRSA